MNEVLGAVVGGVGAFLIVWFLYAVFFKASDSVKAARLGAKERAGELFALDGHGEWKCEVQPRELVIRRSGHEAGRIRRDLIHNAYIQTGASPTVRLEWTKPDGEKRVLDFDFPSGSEGEAELVVANIKKHVLR